jgi:hypothetical protein
MAASDAISIENLRSMLVYDHETGIIRWKVKRGNRAAGSVAGRVANDGRIHIGFFGANISAHRIAWAMHYGAWPSIGIDHRNGIPTDNRILNLREASQLVNTQNRRAANKGSRSGLLGVSWKSKVGRWRAQIRHGGKLHHLGYFESAEAAHAVYLAEKRRHHEGCEI